MSLETRLRALVDAAPPDATVPVRWLGELLAEEGRPLASGATTPAAVDLTVEQLAEQLGRGVSTVRTWLGSGAFPGAYKLRNREWRIPQADVVAFQRGEAERHRSARVSAGSPPRDVDTSAWRKHLKKAS